MANDRAAISGARLRALREAKGWSQPDLAKASGVDQSVVSRIESGKSKNPRADSARLLAVALGVAVEALQEPIDGSAPSDVDHLVAPPPAAEVPALRVTIDTAVLLAREVVDQLMQRLAAGEVLPVASAGAGAPAEIDLVRPQITRIQREAGLQRGPLIPFEVVGDCLEPRLRPGWIAWVNPEARRRPGDVVLALVDGEEMFKVLTRDRDTGAEFLTALNGQPPIAVGPNVDIQGVVQLVQHSP